jgi:hypothetical protein
MWTSERILRISVRAGAKIDAVSCGTINRRPNTAGEELREQVDLVAVVMPGDAQQIL